MRCRVGSQSPGGCTANRCCDHTHLVRG
jgi:hypothetical protein